MKKSLLPAVWVLALAAAVPFQGHAHPGWPHHHRASPPACQGPALQTQNVTLIAQGTYDPLTDPNANDCLFTGEDFNDVVANFVVDCGVELNGRITVGGITRELDPANGVCSLREEASCSFPPQQPGK